MEVSDVRSVMRKSEEFYEELGVEGLKGRKEKIHTRKELAGLKKLLGKNKGLKILDVGCGYGRFTIPLAMAGYSVEGIDISSNLVRAARKSAKEKCLKIRFREGDMRKLPYPGESFDRIICMWSVFVELSKNSDQIKSIKEMLRVLCNGGSAVLEMPKPERMTRGVVEDKRRGIKFKFEKNKRVISGKIDGVEFPPSFRHDKKTLSGLMKACSVKDFKIEIVNFGGRGRMILQFWK